MLQNSVGVRKYEDLVDRARPEPEDIDATYNVLCVSKTLFAPAQTRAFCAIGRVSGKMIKVGQSRHNFCKSRRGAGRKCLRVNLEVPWHCTDIRAAQHRRSRSTRLPAGTRLLLLAHRMRPDGSAHGAVECRRCAARCTVARAMRVWCHAFGHHWQRRRCHCASCYWTTSWRYSVKFCANSQPVGCAIAAGRQPVRCQCARADKRTDLNTEI